MSRARQHFRQSDLVKALKAMAKAGVQGRVEITLDKIVVFAGGPDQAGSREEGKSELMAGELLLSFRERGLCRAHGGGDQKTPLGRSRASLATLGFKSWATANRWMIRAREARSTSPHPQGVGFQDNADIK
jgi:hypothetical protein